MKPLESVTILEFSTMITASLASMMMAEQGARVIKVEPMEMGDPMRYIGARKADISALFANCNRGKESLRIDLKSPDGVETIKSMIPSVDVVIHNFRPGVMDKLGLGSETLRTLNPKLIYAAISGFGTKGPLSSAPAYDPMIQAHAGVAAAQGKVISLRSCAHCSVTRSRATPLARRLPVRCLCGSEQARGSISTCR